MTFRETTNEPPVKQDRHATRSETLQRVILRGALLSRRRRRRRRPAAVIEFTLSAGRVGRIGVTEELRFQGAADGQRTSTYAVV